REAVLYLTGFFQRSFYGRDYQLKENISMQDLMFRVRSVVQREHEVISNQLRRNQVTVLDGMARFVDPHTVEITGGGVVSAASQQVTSEFFLIWGGTRPSHKQAIPLDGKRIFDSDQLPSLENLPRELIVVGGGVIGIEFASMF